VPQPPDVDAATPRRITHREFAAVLKVSDRACKMFAREDGAPHSSAGWQWPDCMHWYVRREVRRSRPQAPSDLTEAKLRQEIAAAETAELKLAELRGELMTVTEFEAALTEALYRVSARLDNLAMRAAPMVLGLKSKAEALRILESLVDEARAELSRGDDLPDEDDEPEEEAA
jgi:hypothetical protein